MKCTIIVDQGLPLGLIANTTAALGVSLSNEISGLVGKDLWDANQNIHKGITNLNLPVLAMDKTELRKLYLRLLEEPAEDIMVIGFNNVAQTSKSYGDYEKRLLNTPTDKINLLGVCLYGRKKKINKLTGNLKLLK
jgi:hypothetical protein